MAKSSSRHSSPNPASQIVPWRMTIWGTPRLRCRVVDVLTPEQRSACMRAVGSKNTAPEMRVRRLAHAMGYRYALHARKLPGRPDLVFVSRRKIIFVHGCFWHKHKCRHGRVSPATNSNYWNGKRERNVERDSQHVKALRKEGWKVLVIWECWTGNTISLRNRLKAFLEPAA
jgi:DNA mismatch endonuclease, patch repair protein